MVVLHPVEIPRFESAVFSSLPDSFAAVLGVKGALTPRLNCGAPLTAPGRCKPALLGRKSKNKNTPQLLLRGGRRLLVLCLGPDFHRKILRQDRLRTTISNSLDPEHPPCSSFSLHPQRKAQAELQRSLHIKRTKDLLLQSFFHGSPQNLRTMALQNPV